MTWRSILSRIRRALWPTTSDFLIGQCTACLTETEGLERTTSGLMCPMCAREWRSHEAEREASLAPVNHSITVHVNQNHMEEFDNTIDRMREEVSRALRVPPAMFGRREGTQGQQVDQCPQGRTHEWLPWNDATGQRQGDICATCGNTRRDALAVEVPPIYCRHRWLTEENVANRTVTIRCRTCAETHVIDRDDLEDQMGLDGILALYGGHFTGGTPTGRSRSHGPASQRIPATRREPDPPPVRMDARGNLIPRDPPNQGSSGRRPRASAAPTMPPAPPKKPQRLQPVAPRPPRPIKLD